MASIDLPPELWMLIFEHATFIPGLFDVSPMSPIVDQPRAWLLYDKALRADIMKTKKALVIVCRSWQNSARKLLWEHIQISRFDTWKRLEDVLTLSPEQELLRSYTKRLDIVFNTPRHPPTRGEKRDYTVFNRIPSMFQNVRIFDLGIEVNLPDDYLSVLPKFDHLQSLSMRNGPLDATFTVISLVLRLLPTLRHIQAFELEISVAGYEEEEDDPHWGGSPLLDVFLPQLHPLSLIGHVNKLLLWISGSWTPPSLERVTIDGVRRS
jgi:hypothetical protein